MRPHSLSQRVYNSLCRQVTADVFFSLLLCPPPCEAADVKTLFQTARPSVVLVMSLDANRQPLALGSGFFVGSGREIVTNYHVIKTASAVRIKLLSGNVGDTTTVLSIDVEHDLALLEAPFYSRPLPLATKRPEIGDEVIAIGNPSGLEGTLSKGIVSGVRGTTGSVFYQITAAISHGSSGGPVIDERGKVIGVSSFYLKEGQALNFAMPSVYIRQLLRSKYRFSLGGSRGHHHGDTQALRDAGLGSKSRRTAANEPDQVRWYTVQVGSYLKGETAKRIADRLKAAGHLAFIRTAEIPGKGRMHRVRVGLFEDREKAKRFGEELARREPEVKTFFATVFD